MYPPFTSTDYTLTRAPVARIEEQDSGSQITPPTSSEELRERL
jgi:hypothetical protein